MSRAIDRSLAENMSHIDQIVGWLNAVLPSALDEEHGYAVGARDIWIKDAIWFPFESVSDDYRGWAATFGFNNSRRPEYYPMSNAMKRVGLILWPSPFTEGEFSTSSNAYLRANLWPALAAKQLLFGEDTRLGDTA